MANEEQTQIFRGDDMPPEMAIAETGGPTPRRRPASPSDQRSLHDQEHGPSEARHIHDSRDELADLRQLHDAGSGPSDARHLHDADGLSDARHLHDADGLSDVRSLHDAEGLSDTRSLHDADGVIDTAHARDADGPSDVRSLQDAEGLIDTRHAHDADGPSIRREMQDATHAPGAPQELGSHQFHGDPAVDGDDDLAPDEVAVVEPEPVPEAAPSDPDLTFKVDEDATPWALSIHLEARIASLSESTAKVNEQLGGLEDSIRRLAKRIGK